MDWIARRLKHYLHVGRPAAIALGGFAGHVSMFYGWVPEIVWFVNVPWLWLWRTEESSRIDGIKQSCVVGLALGWTVTEFMSVVPGWAGIGIRLASSALLATWVVVVQQSAASFRGRHAVVNALCVACALTMCECAHAWLGISWCLHSQTLSAVDLGVGQLASFVNNFGVCGLIAFVNGLFAEAIRSVRNGVMLWLLGFGLALLLTVLGHGIGSIERSDLPRCTMAVIQPGIHRGEDWSSLCRSRLAKLSVLACQKQPNTRILIWPESAGGIVPEHLLSDWADRLLSTLNDADVCCVTGLTIRSRVLRSVGGLEVSTEVLRSCAALIESRDSIQLHEKQVLLPIREWFPPLIRGGLLEKWVRRSWKLPEDYEPGAGPGSFVLPNDAGVRKRCGVAVCYESFFPWLNCFDDGPDCNIVIHLAYDGDTWDHPIVIERQLLACRMRAIETRRWQVVCTAWNGSAVIDPTGQVYQRLGSGPGFLLCSADAVAAFQIGDDQDLQ